MTAHTQNVLQRANLEQDIYSFREVPSHWLNCTTNSRSTKVLHLPATCKKKYIPLEDIFFIADRVRYDKPDIFHFLLLSNELIKTLQKQLFERTTWYRRAPTPSRAHSIEMKLRQSCLEVGKNRPARLTHKRTSTFAQTPNPSQAGQHLLRGGQSTIALTSKR